MFKAKTISKVLAASALLFTLAQVSQAADLRFQRVNSAAPNRLMQLGATESFGNLYAFAPQLLVNSAVSKDLVAAGAMLSVNSNVARNLIAAGANVTVKGNVGASARIVGANVTIESKTISEDLVVAGGTVFVDPGTVINGDVLVAGGTVFVEGTVNGNIKMTGGALAIGGKVSGNVDATVRQYLELEPGADIKGKINYTAPAEMFRDPSAKVTGAINYTAAKASGFGTFAGFITLALIIKLLAHLILALALYAIFKTKFTHLVTSLKHGNFWKDLGIGLAALIVVPVAVIILFLAIVGYYAAVFVALLYFLALLLAWIIGAAYFGSYLLALINKKDFVVDYTTIIVGLLVAGILVFIPVIGWIFGFILELIGLGAIVRSFKSEN